MVLQSIMGVVLYFDGTRLGHSPDDAGKRCSPRSVPLGGWPISLV